MSKQIRKRNQRKKGLSEMLSYVILIAITVGLSIAVFALVKSLSNVSAAADCDEGTSLIITDQKIVLNKMTLTLRNNGRFNIDGVIIAVSNQTEREPTIYLWQDDSQQEGIHGQAYFPNLLLPGKEEFAVFSNIDSNQITYDLRDLKSVQIQPFVIRKNERVMCKNAVIKQNL